MTPSLRILVKRNGEPVAQRKDPVLKCGNQDCCCQLEWIDDPSIPIVHEPEEEKSFGQVAYEAWYTEPQMPFKKTSYEANWNSSAKAVLDEAKKRGWREP